MTKVFQVDTPNESTGFLMWKVNNHWQREIKAALSDFKLTHTQFVVLANSFWLGLEQGDVTQTDISQQLGLDKMVVSNVLKILVTKELVIRKEHKIDTRAKTISLTKQGKQVLKKAVKSVEDIDMAFFGKLKNRKAVNVELLRLLDRQ